MTLVDKSSGVAFDFDEKEWQAWQYDEEADVNKAAGAGLTCIDIIAIYRQRQLFLMEAKNYRNRPLPQVSHIEKQLQPNSEKQIPIGAIVAENIKDSIVFLSYYSLLQTIEKPDFWNSIRAFLLDKNKEIHVIFWLELDHTYPNIPKQRLHVLKHTLQEQLSRKLRWLTSTEKIVIKASNDAYPLPGVSISIR